jgi:hypothetical protein
VVSQTELTGVHRTMRGGIWRVTISHTMLPKRRWRTPSSIVSSKSSASSSLIAMSASRVTWNGWAARISMARKECGKVRSHDLFQPDHPDTVIFLAGLCKRVQNPTA